MKDKLFKTTLHLLANAKSQEQQISILKDLYYIGHLDAYENPVPASKCMENISNICGLSTKIHSCRPQTRTLEISNGYRNANKVFAFN